MMIGLFLTSLISTILIQSYLINKRQFQIVHNSLENHFDVQWVHELMADSIRRAGFTPCLNVDSLTALDRRRRSKPIRSLAIQEKPQSLHVNRMNEQFAELLQVQALDQILVTSEVSLHPQQSILIADCEHAEVHEVVRVEKFSQGFLLTLAKPLWFDYPSTTYVGQWLEEQWSIKNGTLYYQQIHSEELSSLIHSIQARKKRIGDKTLVDVILGLDNEEQHQFVVGVRS